MLALLADLLLAHLSNVDDVRQALPVINARLEALLPSLEDPQGQPAPTLAPHPNAAQQEDAQHGGLAEQQGECSQRLHAGTSRFALRTNEVAPLMPNANDAARYGVPEHGSDGPASLYHHRDHDHDQPHDLTGMGIPFGGGAAHTAAVAGIAGISSNAPVHYQQAQLQYAHSYGAPHLPWQAMPLYGNMQQQPPPLPAGYSMAHLQGWVPPQWQHPGFQGVPGQPWYPPPFPDNGCFPGGSAVPHSGYAPPCEQAPHFAPPSIHPHQHEIQHQINHIDPPLPGRGVKHSAEAAAEDGRPSAKALRSEPGWQNPQQQQQQQRAEAVPGPSRGRNASAHLPGGRPLYDEHAWGASGGGGPFSQLHYEVEHFAQRCTPTAEEIRQVRCCTSCGVMKWSSSRSWGGSNRTLYLFYLPILNP